ncbi:hypothetical protein [Miniphocaeibacter halophilus]|uniref:Uncharacterized protein n=1 Tax=Miniphocaeibacter halophilus TaxID=2931922 RepID=A0AC61MWQ1_9FIRM|nr:hypothetical protein [Miniphocaeibacter halophilus]QQK08789.1 hypothetical protein JFY71_04455 [Miniphocaeibacter halophilus]
MDIAKCYLNKDEIFIRKYRLIYENSKKYLRPNLKNIKDILLELKEKYTIIDFNDEAFLEVVKNNTDEKYGKTNNDSKIKGYKIINDEKSKDLFLKSEEALKEMGNILIGINLNNNGFYVEGSNQLKRRIICERGLSQEEINNIFLATEYIICSNG